MTRPDNTPPTLGDAKLDAAFKDLRDQADGLIDRDREIALSARILDVALAEIPEPVMPKESAVHQAPEGVTAGREAGILAGLLNLLGGWPAVAGLSVAAMTGVLVGYSPPPAVDSVAAQFLPSTSWSTEVLPLFDGYLIEGSEDEL